MHADPDDLGRGKYIYILCSPSWLNNLTWALHMMNRRYR